MPAVTSIATLANYRTAISSKPTIVDFWAVWCGPCKAIKPRFEALAAQYPSVQALSVNVDEEKSIAAEVGITAMPTFVCYVGGKRVKEVVGANPDALALAFSELAKQ